MTDQLWLWHAAQQVCVCVRPFVLVESLLMPCDCSSTDLQAPNWAVVYSGLECLCGKWAHLIHHQYDAAQQQQVE
jgi:hypothetical protein